MISRRSWLAELIFVSFSLLLLIGIGLWNGYPATTLLPPVLLYLAWHLYQLYRFSRWLERPKRNRMPWAIGIWRSICATGSELRERSRKHKRRLRSMLDGFQESTDALPDATIVIDDHDRIEWWNSAAAELLQLSGRSAKQMSIDQVIQDPIFRRSFREQDYTKPLQIPAPLDQSITLEVRIVPYGKGKRLFQARDITRLQQLETVRRDFVANVSHEIRTPLTVVHGYMEMLSEAEDEALQPWHQAFVQMHKQSLRMQRLVEDLLLLARLESSRGLDAQGPVEMEPLLHAVREEAEGLSGDNGHQIETELDTEVNIRGSVNELYSAFSNLVNNAVRYSPAGSCIRMRWGLRQGQPCFSVSDSGIGIDQEHIPRLTERFYRVDIGRSRQSGGTGLGLAIVKHVLTRHNGHLQIDSEVGKGSTFSCYFGETENRGQRAEDRGLSA
ncbi:MAG: phosphate regulon sensor histidine kinase PhoR [Gammaproteobacteria bacterium SHHR-1]|uniref:phosphate regulon sensor histidine kinase PhoR n=1 Tax=Magnetovirga frankeli TaxID=947516 RepID=UPI00129400F2|nr:phosphate regulon sensor histidine kinase PhoR [gamma proteobacterium SS-5]